LEKRTTRRTRSKVLERETYQKKGTKRGSKKDYIFQLKGKKKGPKTKLLPKQKKNSEPIIKGWGIKS